MTPVEQRTTYDCLTACLASIFECAYEDAPQLADSDGEPLPRWHGIYDGWLAARGWAVLERVLQHGDEVGSQRSPWGFPGYWIAGVTSPRYDGEHAVVMHGNEIAYDPHPQREMGHRGFTSAEYFLPLNIAAFTLASATDGLGPSPEKGSALSRVEDSE